jgi:hypothetical protein
MLGTTLIGIMQVRKPRAKRFLTSSWRVKGETVASAPFLEELWENEYLFPSWDRFHHGSCGTHPAVAFANLREG